MSLRKSPRRTRALLAANRRNSRKSTGPRTPIGKWHSAGNAVRHYRRTRPSSCIPIESTEIKAFEDFYFALRQAIMPADNAAGTEAVLLNAARVWRVKRSFDRWIETRTEEDWLVLAAGAVPRPRSWRLKLRRPGLPAPDWIVTASVCLRRSRRPIRGLGQSGKRSRRPATDDHEKDRPRMHAPKMHAMVSVHSTGPFRPAEALEGQPSEPESQRTNPESYSSQSSSENMSLPANWDPAYAEAYALAERIVGWLMGGRKRTKPKSFRKHGTCKNMSPAGERAGRNPNGSDGATALGRVLRAMKKALVPRKEYSQLPLFQTKPECKRKEGTYKNVSKALGWLRAAPSSLFKREPYQRQPTFTQPASRRRPYDGS